MDGEEEKKAGDEFTESDEESGETLSEEELNNLLLEAARLNSLEEVTHWLENKASPIFKKDKWSPLLWAACNGNEDIVRVLIKYNSHSEYVQQPKMNIASEEAKPGDEGAEDEEKDPFVKPPDAKKIGKYTPLHWASYKGFFKVVWLLLKAGVSPLDIDEYGNTAVH